MEFIVNHPDELLKVAKEVVDTFGEDRVFLFYGGMGAGKTTFIKALCEALEVTDTTSSPTFSIVNEYESPTGSVYHFDFYRLREEQEAFDMGYEEYLYSGNYCFIEWPEKIANLLPPDAKRVNIDILSPQNRKITFS